MNTHYTMDDVTLLAGILQESKDSEVRRARQHISFAHEFGYIKLHNTQIPDEIISKYLEQNFAEDTLWKWHDFIFEESLSEMPLHINDGGLSECFAKWRLQVAK